MNTTDLAANDTNHLAVGNGFETQTWRLHRYATAIKAVYLPKAGKRGAACPELQAAGELEEAFVQTIVDAVRDGDFVKVRRAFLAGEELEGVRVDERLLRAVDVKPGGFERVIVRGARFTLEVDHEKFIVQDIVDEYNEPTAIPSDEHCKRSVAKLYKFAKEHKAELTHLTFHGVLGVLKQQGIKYHSFCAVDLDPVTEAGGAGDQAGDAGKEAVSLIEADAGENRVRLALLCPESQASEVVGGARANDARGVVDKERAHLSSQMAAVQMGSGSVRGGR